MALGIGAGVENLVTKVSLLGVQETERNQKLVGAGFRALKGDIAGAAAEMKALGVAGALVTTGIGTGMAYGATRFGASIVDTTIRIDSLRQGLIALAGSEAEAEIQLRRLKEVAKLPGLGFEDAIQGSVTLQSAGLSARLAEDAMRGFGNALATVGRGKADLDGVIRALGQIMGKGKISAEEINQIAERVPQIRAIMKDAFGTANTEELQKMGLDSEQFISRIVASLQKLPRAAGGLRNDVENLSDAWNQFLYGSGSGSKGGISGAIGLATKALTTFNNLNEATHGLAGGAVVATTALVGISGVIIAVTPAINLLRNAWLEVAGAASTATVAQKAASTAGAGAGATAGKISGAGKFGKLGGALSTGLRSLAIYEGIKIGTGFGVDKLQEDLKNNPSQANRAKFGFGVAGSNIAAGVAGGWSQAGPIGAVVGAVIGAGAAFMDFNKRNKENQDFWTKPKTESQFNPGGSTSTESPVIKYLKEIAYNTKATVGGGSRSANAYNSGDVQRALFNALNAQVV
jgi:tape measure domain-containing protein